MTFDWIAFLDTYRIEYSGDPSREWVNINCPFCGDDPSFHLGVRTTTTEPGFHCWRDAEHRGRDPLRLVQALLDCSKIEAIAAIRAHPGHVRPVRREETPAPQTGPLFWPEHIKPLVRSSRYTQPFLKYLLARGFDEPALFAITYDLRYSLVEEWAWRLIIPIWTPDEGLVSWTARAIHPGVEPRYRTLSKKPAPGQNCALRSAKEVIYYPPGLRSSDRVLVITEGPLDALKVDCYGSSFGVRATCLFGKDWNENQLLRLAKLSVSFSAVTVLLDADASHDSNRLARALSAQLTATSRSPPTVAPKSLPSRFKDPGELGAVDIRQLFG